MAKPETFELELFEPEIFEPEISMRAGGALAGLVLDRAVLMVSASKRDVLVVSSGAAVCWALSRGAQPISSADKLISRICFIKYAPGSGLD
ncbi:hypothetical protein GCM10027046_06460 [Uliginosibacterium flavum]